MVGTITGTALQVTGPFASVTGNIVAGSALNVVGTMTGTALQITGPFASVTGNVVAGSSLIAATVTSRLLTVATTADVYGVLSARAGTGSLQVINSVNPSLQVISGTGTQGELGMVTTAGQLSSSSTVGDLVLRAVGGGRLLLNTGLNSAAVVCSGTMVGINKSPTLPLDVNGSVRCTNNLFANNSSLGDCGLGSLYACFSHSSRFTTGGYSFLSDNTGATYINCSIGKQINFRCNNSQIATLNSSGGLTCSALYLPASGPFTGYTSQLYNNSNWVASGSNISQFNNNSGYVTSGSSPYFITNKARMSSR